MNKPIINGRISRRLLLMQEFNITILDRPGKDNQVIDFLSRLHLSGDIVLVSNNFPDEHLFAITVKNPWFIDIANYLSFGKLSSHFTNKEKKKIIRVSVRQSWVNGDLFYTRDDILIRKCIREDEILDILKACHDETLGGHFAEERTSYKVLNLGYFCPSILKGSKTYVKKCDNYQGIGMPVVSEEILLKPQVLKEPFERWSLEFVGPLNPPSNGKKQILVCTHYVKKWLEAKEISKATEYAVVSFIFVEISI